ncbi:uncharacterized protein LOC110247640 isoform X3 [Exaiptasia diaphana]|nr:uncharacterized protein LOC110247640 isoform X3 [Exaiptasia diaphana]XP_028517618.1 uncharacterized protein LOC110247640 isoform X3 [Exaiptasia diaphana]KXJ28398.1 hypothetical protein AC249_AIPGENE23281 [Exaiptasia diaphana]
MKDCPQDKSSYKRIHRETSNLYAYQVKMTSLKILFSLVVVMLNCSRCFSFPHPSSNDLSIYTMDIKEPLGNSYQEIVGIDSLRQLEFFGVPTYGRIDGAEFLLDFKKNITMARIPRLKACFMANGIDSDLPSPRKLQETFQEPSIKLDTIKTKQTKWRKTGAFTRRRVLNPKMRKLCDGYPIYRVVKDTSNLTGPIKRQDKACHSQVCHDVNKCYQTCYKCQYVCRKVRYCYKVRC